MKDVKINETLKKSCIEVLNSFQKINQGNFEDIQSRLEWVLGSYEYDQNPVGLHEIGGKALSTLKTYKVEKPKAVTKKVLDSLEKSILKFEKAYH